MKLTETRMPGVWILELEPHVDARGFFARTFDAEQLAAHGIDGRIAQCSLSYNARAGTLRGMHFQRAPHEEAKIVRCTRGRIHDVLVDLRPTSPTYRQWVAVELSAESRRSLCIPAGVAHGFLTLDDDTEVSYQISTPFAPDAADGLRWDDPALGIVWPAPVSIISDRDQSFPLLATRDDLP